MQKAALFTLIFANLVALWQFTNNNGSILEVLWIYWLQSVVIGVMNLLRLLTFPLKPVGSEVGIKISSPKQAMQVQVLARIGGAGFFAIHYGGIHLVYAVFLWVFGQPNTVVNGIGDVSLKAGDLFKGSIDVRWISLTGALFALHHLITAVTERRLLQEDPTQAPTVSGLMLRPYVRIFPMHLIVIFGPFLAYYTGTTSVSVAFMALKSIADIVLFTKGVGHPGTINPAKRTYPK